MAKLIMIEIIGNKNVFATKAYIQTRTSKDHEATFFE
jgi:hypothetical protein